MGHETDTQVARWREPAEAGERERTPVLIVIQGDEIGRCYPLHRERLVLGRSTRRADLVVPDPTLSGVHVRFELDAQGRRCTVRDLGSRNGTHVNGDRVDVSPLQDGDKLFVGATVLKFTFHDPIEERFHGELEQLLHVDSLTGLFVRRWFDRELPRAFERARVEGAPFSVLMMDLDGLKPINDRHGHQLGSHCIAEAGALIRQSLESRGAGARFGGDEFVAMLPGQGLDDALDLAERIRARIEAHEFREGDVVVTPTISIGAAALDTELRPEELLRRADDALYRAKKAGRNAVSD